MGTGNTGLSNIHDKQCVIGCFRTIVYWSCFWFHFFPLFWGRSTKFYLAQYDILSILTINAGLPKDIANTRHLAVQIGAVLERPFGAVRYSKQIYKSGRTSERNQNYLNFRSMCTALFGTDVHSILYLDGFLNKFSGIALLGPRRPLPRTLTLLTYHAETRGRGAQKLFEYTEPSSVICAHTTVSVHIPLLACLQLTWTAAS